MLSSFFCSAMRVAGRRTPKRNTRTAGPSGRAKQRTLHRISSPGRTSQSAAAKMHPVATTSGFMHFRVSAAGGGEYDLSMKAVVPGSVL